MPHNELGFVLTGEFIKNKLGEYTAFDRSLIEGLFVSKVLQLTRLAWVICDH